MTDLLPELKNDGFSGSLVEPWGQFEDIVENAGNDWMIGIPPVNKKETYDIDSQRIRIQTIASRLWLLGYLPKKIHSRRIAQKLGEIQQAVIRFQGEANLKQDSWVGDKTWYALDELVGFESKLTEEQWFSGGMINLKTEAAVHRAIQLRLWCLGLYRNKPSANFKLLETEALSKFENIVKMFRIKTGHFVAGFNDETIKILFNQDILTDSLITENYSQKTTFSYRITSRNKEGNDALAKKFIVNCAKIELWLLGYDVDIDGRDDFEISDESKLYQAISRYYQHFENHKKPEADTLAKTISPALFRGMVAANKINNDNNTDDASAWIAREITTEREMENARSYLKEKGMRLWDGLKRIWRWFKKIGEKAITFLKENIYMGFFRFTTKAFKIIKSGLSEVVKSLKIYWNGELVVSQIIFRFSKDMDTTVYLPAGLHNEAAATAIGRLKKQSKAFVVACEITSLIFRIFRVTWTCAVGLIRLLYALLKGYRELKNLYIDFKSLAVT